MLFVCTKTSKSSAKPPTAAKPLKSPPRKTCRGSHGRHAQLNGVEAARQIMSRQPDTAIVMLSMHSDESYVLRS